MRWPLSRFSNAAHNNARLPEARPNPAGWIESLRSAVVNLGIDLVLQHTA
jgi:hypothetical protein